MNDDDWKCEQHGKEGGRKTERNDNNTCPVDEWRLSLLVPPLHFRLRQLDNKPWCICKLAIREHHQAVDACSRIKIGLGIGLLGGFQRCWLIITRKESKMTHSKSVSGGGELSC